MLEKIKGINRALLELELGIIFLGILGMVIVSFLLGTFPWNLLSMLLGTVLAMAGAYHMYIVLDRALDLGDKAPNKMIAGSILRYTVLIVVLLIIIKTGLLDPMITFVGVMFLKVASYLQPFTHKLCNAVFHETDPVAMPLEEDLPETVHSAEEIATEKTAAEETNAEETDSKVTDAKGSKANS